MVDRVTSPRGEKLLVFAHQDEAVAFADVPYLITGIGKVNAAVLLSRALAAGEVSEVIVLGTAGMLDDTLDLETVYQVSSAVQHDFEFVSPAIELGEKGHLSLQNGSLASADLADLPGATGPTRVVEERQSQIPTAAIATGDVYLADDADRERIGGEASLVDMETYAYARACVAFHVPLRVFKIPSDRADSETTHETWDTIVARKSHQLLEFAQEQQLI